MASFVHVSSQGRSDESGVAPFCSRDNRIAHEVSRALDYRAMFRGSLFLLEKREMEEVVPYRVNLLIFAV